jgi:glycosidase
MSHPWWHRAVIYQIYPRSFKDTTGTGVGDLGGIVANIDYLSDTLGVDALWLSPFYPSPMKDFGYDVADYCGVDPLFGDLDAFDRLVEAAHARGLKLIVDYVPNHSSDQHPWFQASRSSRDHPKRDWYVWEDPAPDGGPPNNWLSIFGGSAWEWDEATEQYYLHTFLKEQPDLNWRHPQVREAMFDVLRFWMDRGVDGFRVDVAQYVMKDPALRDNPEAHDEGLFIHRSLGAYDEQVHLYDTNHPDVHDVYREVRDVLEEYDDPERVGIGEIHLFDWPRWAAFYGDDLDEFHLPFNFHLLGVEWTAAAVEQVVNSLEAALPEGAWPNYVLGNHDEPRMATRLGAENTRLAALLLLTLRGTPTLYYGDELGLPEVDVPTEKRLDLQADGLEKQQNRDGCRTPMPWTDGPAAGFSDADPDDLWLPLGDDHRARSVEQQAGDPDALLALYRRLLKLRAASPALEVGAYTPITTTPQDVFTFLRSHDDEQLLVALNFADAAQRFLLPSGAHDVPIRLSTEGDRTGEVVELYLELAPREGVIVEYPDTV